MSAYYREDEVARLIQNMVQWGGDGAPVRGDCSIWARLVRELRRGSASVPVVGIDAGYTKAALSNMPESLSGPLVVYHTSSLTVAMQARQHFRIGPRAYHSRLHHAHPLFIELYRAARAASQI